MAINFKTEDRTTYTIVSFTLSEPISPSTLREITPPTVRGNKGVVISGRGPIWLYCYLTHYYHYCTFVAIHDPRLGAVIVETHTTDAKVGEILQIDIGGEHD